MCAQVCMYVYVCVYIYTHIAKHTCTLHVVYLPHSNAIKATMMMINVNRRQEMSIKKNTATTAAPTITGINAPSGGVGSEKFGVCTGGAGVVLNKNSVKIMTIILHVMLKVSGMLY